MTSSGKWITGAVALSLLVGGCSFPGMRFHGQVPAEQNQKVSNYLVERITPQLLLAQATARQRHEVGKPNPTLKQAIADYQYKVEPRDVLGVAIWGDPNVTATFTANTGGTSGGSSAGSSPNGFKVSPDGTIYFPYVGEVQVAGKTTDQIRAELTQRLKPYLNNPQITVNVAAFNSQKYQLAGAVEKPGLYPVTDVPLTVSQAIAAAGGILQQRNVGGGGTSARPLGDLAHVLYVHDGQRSVLNLHALAQYADASQDRLVRPGDIIQVPDNSYAQVHLIGEVRSPGNYPLDNSQLNLADALGEAGGLDITTANPARIFVFRGAYSKPQVFWLDASSPDAMLLATSFELEPQDVVYVAAAGVVSWNRVISQILPTVQGLYETEALIRVHP